MYGFYPSWQLRLRSFLSPLPFLSFISHLPPPLFFSLSHHFSVLSHFLSSFLSQLTSLFLAPCACSLSVPSFIFLPSSLKIILSQSGKKSGCIRVMRKFKSPKEDCTIVCEKLIFHSVNVCLSVYVSTVCVFSSLNASACFC